MQLQSAPIGYWIKQADVTLTSGIDEIQFVLGRTRTDWQVLHIVYENGAISSTDLAEQLKEFADITSVIAILNRFVERDLLQEEMQTFRLTVSGVETHKAALEKQVAFRQKAMINISKEEYETTIATLKKLIQNLRK